MRLLHYFFVKKTLKTGVLLVLLISLSGCLQQTQFGVKDDKAANMIERANKLTLLYDKKQYHKIERVLRQDLMQYQKSPASLVRIYNELADLYSHNLLDLEKAIDSDRRIKDLGSTSGINLLQIKADVANNLMLLDQSYKDNYINVDVKTIQDKSLQRILDNQALLKSDILKTKKKYEIGFLKNNHKLILQDLKQIPEKTTEYFRVLSRLIRVEYEIYRTTGDKKTLKNAKGAELLLSKKVKLQDLDLSEIDFLSLADYFDLASFWRNDLILSEYALFTVYRPYLNLSDEQYRWTYNKLINTYIDGLVDKSYKLKRNKKLIYYASLNKSRMILEDKAKYEQGNLANLSVQTYGLNEYGLPSWQQFENGLAQVRKNYGYLDFYMTGDFFRVPDGEIESKKLEQDSYLVTRGLKVANKTDRSVDVYREKAMYISYVNQNRIYTKKVDNRDLKAYRKNINQMGSQLSALNTANESKQARGLRLKKVSRIQNQSKNYFKFDFLRQDLTKEIVISPDKWLARYPLGYIYGLNNSIRSLNIFSAPNIKNKKVNNVKITGYFNPTLDLPESEEELTYIDKLFPNSQLYARESATLSQLKTNQSQNILHLSMHGLNNSESPNYSKLFFAGSKLNDSSNDASALYAHQMASYEQLKNNELVFTAACETGLIKNTATNESEILGILRPLLSNNNKNVILTLWEVETNSARDFVKFFYKNLKQNNDIKSSFYNAKKQLKKQYPDPMYWAPYYLIVSR